MATNQQPITRALEHVRPLITAVIAIAVFLLLPGCSDNKVTDTPTGDSTTQTSPVPDDIDDQNQTDSGNNEPPIDTGDNNSPTSSATYRLTFTASWSQKTHPLNFPDNPHFSALVGAVHNEQIIFWESGQIATSGIQLVAETGVKSDILSEVQTAIDTGSALSTINEGGIGRSPGSIIIEFDVNRNYPQISVVSMLAPSPDWFVGIHNYSLLIEGKFVDNANIDLILYDSGSDSGIQYQSSNSATEPLSPISRVNSDANDSPFINGEPIVGSFTIERLSLI